MDVTHWTRYQVRAEVNKLNFHFIQSARVNIVELNDVHHFGSDSERLEFVDSRLPDNKYHFPVAEHVQGGVCNQYPIQRASKAANEWPESTELPGVSLDQILSLRK